MDRRILVIDDEERLAESLAELLRQEGYQVDCAVGGREGLDRIRKGEYDLIITDLRMPEVDGFTVMDYVGKKSPDSALIVITGHASTESAIEAIHQRVADYITKPFELDFLIASIEKVFAQIETERLREDMMRMITHDIKVPLSSIIGYARFLVDRKTGKVSENVPEYSEKIILNSQKILGLLENYLTHARSESGRLEIHAQPMRLEDAANEAVKLLSAEFRRRRIELQAEVAPLDGLFYGDEPLIFRAISNLLNNAAKYTPNDGWATLSLRRTQNEKAGECVILEVQNSGPGIPADEIPNVFDRYSRASAAKGIEGSGLGLYVVQHVAKAHGGWAECQSVEGECTTFQLILPWPGKIKPQRADLFTPTPWPIH
ncbi:response regulator [bacterium]|nr:response regulator [bacterium]